MIAVSVVIPVHNAGAALVDTVRAMLAQAEPDTQLEVILVDDRSDDAAVELVRRTLPGAPLVVIEGDGRGAAAALNRGVAAARHALIAQVDQDVVVAPGWLARLLLVMTDVDVAAAQGQYFTDPRASLLARVDADAGHRIEAHWPSPARQRSVGRSARVVKKASQYPSCRTN